VGSAARELGKAGLSVTLIDRCNHHLFQPLLYQVATAALSATDIAEPIRKILWRLPSVQVLLADVVDLDLASSSVILREGGAIHYDNLVIATGATHGYFGHQEWASYAPGLKTLVDARSIREQILLAFERAERVLETAEQERLMTFAIVGGGPTGVELSGSIAELARFTLARDFRNIRPSAAKIMLIEAGPRLLPAFSPRASNFAETRLRRLGVDVELNTAVQDIGPDWLLIGDRHVKVGSTFWAAGVAASPVARLLGTEIDKVGRVFVENDLKVRGFDNVFALGDVANFAGSDGKPLPGLAQVAKQQGRHLGRSLARHLRQGEPLEPFRYRGRGNTAIVGRHAAVFEQGRFRLIGWPAWFAWAIIHVYLLVGFQHRMQVSLQWLWRYLTYERGARLISHELHEPKSFNDN